MNNSKTDQVSSFSRSAKGPLIRVPYNSILYGDEIAKDLNQCDSNEFSTRQTGEGVVHENALGSGGDFIAVTKSFPFEMLVETKVCGPAFVKTLKREENEALVFEDDSWEENAIDFMKRRKDVAYTRDEVTYITKMKERLECTPISESNKNVISKQIMDCIGPQSKNSDYTSLGLVNDNDYAHLSVKEQLCGRLVLTGNCALKANFSESNKDEVDSLFVKSTPFLDPIMIMQRDHAIIQYSSYYQQICAERKRISVFTNRSKERNGRQTLLDSVARVVRKRLAPFKSKKNVITGELEGDSEDVDMTSILFNAIDTGDVNIVRTSLSEGAIVDFVSPYSYGRTAFQTVFERLCRMDAGLEMSTRMIEYEEILDILFSHGSDISKLDDGQASNGFAPIHYASLHGKLKRVEWLVRRGANPDMMSKVKQSPLMLACQYGRFEIAYYLIENNANFREYDCSDQTVLHYAAMSGNMVLLKFLVQCGSVHDKLKKNKDGETPLSICYRTCQECSEYLQKATMTKQKMSLYIDKMMNDKK
jgi:hypothetical protein